MQGSLLPGIAEGLISKVEPLLIEIAEGHHYTLSTHLIWLNAGSILLVVAMPTQLHLLCRVSEVRENLGTVVALREILGRALYKQ